MTKKFLGVTDLPRKKDTEDLLNVDAYIKGLCEFIKTCKTPMSIALQGDWGSGKSSFLNQIEENMMENEIKVIFFNTWQYSQMNKDDNLAKIFITSLLNDMGLEDKTKRKISETVMHIGRSVINKYVGDEKLFDTLMDCETGIKRIKSLKDNFKESISEAIAVNAKKYGKENIDLSNERLVILVDDLDRLNPSVAVELLEVIKLFLDVEQCVFVLAIDYDVVVQGVRTKFGKDISIDKCRSFFDKIIQLPFYMPVEMYKLEKMVKEYLGEKIRKEHIEKLSAFAELVIGANPRAFKRLVNSFLLLEIIQNNLHGSINTHTLPYNEEDYAILLCVLCIQINHPQLYSFLSEPEAWLEQVKNDDGFLPKNENEDFEANDVLREKLSYFSDEKMEDKYFGLILNILSALDGILNSLFSKSTKNNNKYDHLSRVINLSAVTHRENTNTSAKQGRRSTPVTIKINKDESSYQVAHEAYKTVAETLLKEHQDKIADCLNKLGRFLTTDPNRKNGFFGTEGKQKRKLNQIYLTEDNQKNTVFIGIHSSTEAKRLQLSELLRVLNINKGFVIWKDAQGEFEL
ncbi:MAG: KAP family NTPase [Defluviitaleaceae bacterium]|nr:KAP family NTPase [Defluviitaleaceae bacterium]